MKIYYFAYSIAAPSTRYRGLYLLEKVKEIFGVDYKIYHPKKIDRFWLLFLLLRLLFLKDNKNIYIFQKISYKENRKYLKVLKYILKRVKNSVYDIDDAVYKTGNSRTVKYFVDKCEKVIVGSENLKEYCGQYNDQVRLITTPVPKPSKLKENKNKTLTIGWIGMYSVHQNNLMEIFFPVLKQLSFNFVFYILGVQNDDQEKEIRDYFYNFDNITLKIIRNVNWESEDEINSHIRNFDIGVMPLIDNEVNRSKSAFKLKQYLVCGVPVLASPVGENLKVVKQEKNGFFCYDKNDWVQKITFFNNLSEDEYKKYLNRIKSYFDKSDFNLDNCSKKFFKEMKKL
jgi:glycosyltransferase involved in cell wall biosynthesis